MKINMVDLHKQYLNIKEEVDNAIFEVINNTAFINGGAVKSFESELAEYNNINHVLGCANGTDALQIAMMTLGFKPGDHVIVPVHTYVATAEVIALLRLEPIFVDVYPDTFTIDTSKIEEAITQKTVAIVPVHLYGQCADMEAILKIANRFNLKVVEDAAQAIGSVYEFSDGTKRKAGTMGDIGTTSFFPSKNLGCFGDGGALFINDENLAKKARKIANHGQSVKYHHDVVGVNSRLDTIQAAILRVKLKKLDLYNSARRDVAERYNTAFKNINQVITPVNNKNSTHVYHQYTLRIDDIDRDVLKKHLLEYGIPSMIYYPIPLHLQKAYRQPDKGEGTFPVTEELSKNVLSLPIHTEMNPDECSYIIDTIVNYLN